MFSRSWKRQQNGFSPETSRKECRPAGTLILAHWTSFCISDFHKCKLTHWCCFKSQRFWSFVGAATVTYRCGSSHPASICFIMGFPLSGDCSSDLRGRWSTLPIGNLISWFHFHLQRLPNYWSSLQKSLWKLGTISWNHPTQGLPSPLYQSCTWPCQG